MDAEPLKRGAIQDLSRGASNPKMGVGNRNIQAPGHCGHLVCASHGRFPRERDHPL